MEATGFKKTCLILMKINLIIIISLFFISCAVGPPIYDTRYIKETHALSSSYDTKDTDNPPPNLYDYLGIGRPSKEVRHKNKLQETNREQLWQRKNTRTNTKTINKN